MKVTHLVVDMIYHPDESEHLVLEGTYQECLEFIQEQASSSCTNTYEIVPAFIENKW